MLVQKHLERRRAVLLGVTCEVAVAVKQRFASGPADVSEAVAELAAQVVDIEDPDAERHSVGVAKFVLHYVGVATGSVREPGVDPRSTALGVGLSRIELLGHHPR